MSWRCGGGVGVVEVRMVEAPPGGEVGVVACRCGGVWVWWGVGVGGGWRVEA